MANSAHDSELYRELNKDIRDGLKNIYTQISAASTSTNALFQEASMQLEEVVKATESAAMDIMDIVEKLLQQAETSKDILQAMREKYPSEPAFKILVENNSSLAISLMAVLTALGFQDITGQRLKKAAEAISAVEKSVVDLYLSSGLALQTAEEQPDKDVKSIRESASKAVEEFRGGRSQLKGPDSSGCSQAKIDDLLSQLGL